MGTTSNLTQTALLAKSKPEPSREGDSGKHSSQINQFEKQNDTAQVITGVSLYNYLLWYTFILKHFSEVIIHNEKNIN